MSNKRQIEFTLRHKQIMQSLSSRREIARKEGERLRQKAAETLKRIEQIHQQMNSLLNSEQPDALKKKE